MNLETINVSAALVMSHFDITVDELNILTNMAMVGGEIVLAEKINNLVKNITPTITIEDAEDRQLHLFPEITSVITT